MTYSARDWSIHPPLLYPDYASTALRAPTRPLVPLRAASAAVIAAPAPLTALPPLDADLTRNAAQNGAPLGEQILVIGRVSDERGRGIPGTLIEVWQANAAGRYAHRVDQHPAPLDPNFLGAGRCLTDESGHFRFRSIRPGAYPWGNHPNAWRPAHIHFSLFGAGFASRLVTQMYFPGDPLLALDPIYLSVPAAGRPLLVATFSLDVTEPGQALGYRFDIVLRGPLSTPLGAES